MNYETKPAEGYLLAKFTINSGCEIHIRSCFCFSDGRVIQAGIGNLGFFCFFLAIFSVLHKRVEIALFYNVLTRHHHSVTGK